MVVIDRDMKECDLIPRNLGEDGSEDGKGLEWISDAYCNVMRDLVSPTGGKVMWMISSRHERV